MRRKKILNRIAALKSLMRAMLKKADDEGRELTADELKEYEGHEAELGTPAEEGKAATGLFSQLAREDRLLAAEKASGNVDQVVEAGDDGASLGAGPAGGVKPQKKIIITGLTTKSKVFKKAEDAYLAGRFFQALRGHKESKLWCREHGIQFLSAPITSDNSTGGILLPTVVANTLIDLKDQYGVFRANANPWPMDADEVRVPRRLTGVTLSYPGENEAAAESDAPTFDGVTLKAKELVGVLPYPKSLATSAVINFGDHVTKELAYAFVKEEDEAGFNGDGTSTHGGIVGVVHKINDGSHAGGIAEAAAGHTGFETLDMTDFTKALAKLPAYAMKLGTVKWYISSVGYAASMARLMFAAGGNTVKDIGGKPTQTFMGIPVELTESLNSTLGADASKFKVLLGALDLSSTIGDRGRYAVEVSPHVYFTKRQLCVMGTQWYDINNHDLGSATAAGPLVALKTPGA